MKNFLSSLFQGASAPMFDSDQTDSGIAAEDRQRVLVVDDENPIADSITAILNRSGFDAVACYSGLSAMENFAQRRPKIVVTDVALPDLDGVRLAMTIRALYPDTRVVLFSGNSATVHLLDLAATDGASFEFLSKPVHPVQLLKTLRTTP